MTKETSPWAEERQLDLTVEAVKRLLTWGYESYGAAFEEQAIGEQAYWSGYIRALHQLMETGLDLTVGAVKRLLIRGYESYGAAFKKQIVKEQMYWDGYIRALHHVMEAEDE